MCLHEYESVDFSFAFALRNLLLLLCTLYAKLSCINTVLKFHFLKLFSFYVYSLFLMLFLSLFLSWKKTRVAMPDALAAVDMLNNGGGAKADTLAHLEVNNRILFYLSFSYI